MNNTTATVSKQLIGIQYLRAIAALMVAYLHLLIQIPQYRSSLEAFLGGTAHLGAGVDLFFVISGFIMVVTSSRISPQGFALRRIIRIVPLYWTLTAALVIVAVLKPNLFRTTVVRPEYVIKSLLYIPYANPGQDGSHVPLLVPGWTLNLEMFFYAVFAFALFLPQNRRLLATGTFFALLVFVVPTSGTLPRDSALTVYTDFKLFEFFFGMLIGRYFSAGLPIRSAVVNTLLGLLGLWVLFWGIPYSTFTPGSHAEDLFIRAIPASLVVLSALSLEGWLRQHPIRLLALLGDASYSMYLSHIFILGIARVIWALVRLPHDSPLYAIAFALFGMILTVVGSVLVYRYLETPLLHVAQRLVGIRPKPAVVAARHYG